jgi:hypothetical protein
MADSQGVRVSPEALGTHARSVDRVGLTVQLAMDAAGQVRLGTQAYGQLCQALPAMLDPLHDLAGRVLAEARSALDESARSLRTAADRYSTTDTAAAARFGPPPAGSG